MDKPQVDRSKASRPPSPSSSATPSSHALDRRHDDRDLTDYSKLFWLTWPGYTAANAGKVVRKDHPRTAWESLLAEARTRGGGGEDAEILVYSTFP